MGVKRARSRGYAGVEPGTVIYYIIIQSPKQLYVEVRDEIEWKIDNLKRKKTDGCRHLRKNETVKDNSANRAMRVVNEKKGSIGQCPGGHQSK